jgi:hypothetical protein
MRRNGGLAVDPATGDVLVADENGVFIRHIDADTGIIDTIDRAPCEFDGATISLSGQREGLFVDGAGRLHHTALSLGGGACAPAGTRVHTLGLVTGQVRGFAQALLATNHGITGDAFGNLYTFSEDLEQIVRVDPLGIVTPVAGNGVGLNNGDGGPALDASVAGVRSLVVNAAGDLIFSANNHVRVVRDVARAVSPTPTLEVLTASPTGPIVSPVQLDVRALLDGAAAPEVRVGFEIVVGHRVDDLVLFANGLGETGTTVWTGLDAGVDRYSSRVSLLDRNHEPLTSLTVPITADAPAPRTIVPVGNLDGGINAQLLTGSVTDTDVSFDAFTFGPDGHLWIGDRLRHFIDEVDRDGRRVSRMGDGTNAVPTDLGVALFEPVNVANDVDVDQDSGDVYVAMNAGVGRIRSDGVFEVVAGFGADLAVDGAQAVGVNIASAISVAFDEVTDTLYIGGRSGQTLYAVQPDGLLRVLDFAPGCFPAFMREMEIVPRGLGLANEGHVVIQTRLGTAGCGLPTLETLILDVDPDTSAPTLLSNGLTLAADDSLADGFDFSPVDGKLYFELNDRILRRESDGVYTTIVGTQGTQGIDVGVVPVAGALIDAPRTLEFDADGNLWLNDRGERLRMITAPDTL